MEQKPKFTAIVAVSADGKIAPEENYPTDWTSKEDKDFLHKELDSSDLVVVGNNTFKVAEQPLSKRNCLVFSKSTAASQYSNVKFINPESLDLRDFAKVNNFKKVALLGGAQVYTYCLAKGWIDEIYLTIEPVVFGKGLNMFDLTGDFIKQKLELVSVEKLNDKGTILVKYEVLE